MATTKFPAPAPSNIRDSILRVDRSALIARGVTNPNVTKDSDYYIRAESLSQQLSILYSNQQEMGDQMMPDTAEDDDLVRWLDIFQLSPREAQPAAGPIILASIASTFVATAKQLIDSRGQVFQVTVGGTYANGDQIPIIGISTGAGTNLPQGSVLQWIGGPAFAAATALVGPGVLIGGADKDTNETSRNRLFTYFRNPSQGGNWAQVAQWAVDASASVQAAYVYPALNGPATYALCVVGALSFDATNGWSRGLSDDVLNLVATFVASRMPKHADLVTTTPKDVGGPNPNVDTSVSVGLSLPLSVVGGGPGGGWIDAIPWPRLIGTATRIYVSAVSSSIQFTLTSDDAGNCPTSADVIVGETQIAWFSSAQYAAGQDPLVIATVIAVSGSTGAVVVTISAPFTGIAAGDFIMPNAANIQGYARAYLASMNQMGPGQWTTHAQILVRGSRYPLVTSSNPSDFTATLLRALTDSGDEVLDAAYLYRSTINPGVPSNTTTASPFVLVPKTFAFMDKIP